MKFSLTQSFFEVREKPEGACSRITVRVLPPPFESARACEIISINVLFSRLNLDSWYNASDPGTIDWRHALSRSFVCLLP